MLFIKIIKLIANIIYSFMKLLPVNHQKVLLLSRQFNNCSIDYKLLINELKRQRQDLQIVTIFSRFNKTVKGVFTFFWSQVKSMYHLATSAVVILDSYWPAVSILKQKKELTVIQMWHAAGKIKKTGYQTLDMPYGRKRNLSETMNMHHGYDVIVAGGKALNPFYCMSFNESESKLYNVGLPRLDWLINNTEKSRIHLFAAHPEYIGKTIILYAPTFRTDKVLDCSEICRCLKRDDCALIIKPHQRQQILDTKDVDKCEDMSTMALLAACDYVITDYSAITFEAAAINKKILFYLFDYEKYIANNGLNIDIAKEMPECSFFNAEDLAESIFSGRYCEEAVRRFAEKYLPERLGCSTELISKLIIDCLERGKNEGISRNLNRETEAALHMV